MALINCPNCDKKISDNVKKCIFCGYIIDKEEREKEAEIQAISLKEQEKQIVEKIKEVEEERVAREERQERIAEKKEEYKKGIKNNLKIIIPTIIVLIIVLIVLGIRSQHKYDDIAGVYIPSPGSESAKIISDGFDYNWDDFFWEYEAEDYKFEIKGSGKIEDLICMDDTGDFTTDTGRIKDYSVDEGLVELSVKMDNEKESEVTLHIHPKSGYVLYEIQNIEDDYATLKYITAEILNEIPSELQEGCYQTLSLKEIEKEFNQVKEYLLDDTKEKLSKKVPRFALVDSPIYVKGDLLGITGYYSYYTDGDKAWFRWTPDDVEKHEDHVIYCISEFLGEYTDNGTTSDNNRYYRWDYYDENGWEIYYGTDEGIEIIINDVLVDSEKKKEKLLNDLEKVSIISDDDYVALSKEIIEEDIKELESYIEFIGKDKSFFLEEKSDYIDDGDNHYIISDTLFAVNGSYRCEYLDGNIVKVRFSWIPDDWERHETHIIDCIEKYFGNYSTKTELLENEWYVYTWEDVLVEDYDICFYSAADECEILILRD